MQLIGWLTFSFAGMTLVNRVLEGQFVTAADVSVVNAVILFREVSVFGLFTLPVPNMGFITQGLPHLVKWDYSFFGGNAAIIQYFLYSITAALAFLLFSMIIGLLYNYFGRSRG
jgi:hypothetical protein